MPGAYPQELRDRVINAVIHGGMSRRGAAARFEVSEAAAVKWVQRFEREGSRAAGKMGGHKRVKLDPYGDRIAGWCAEKPDTTLQALCERLGVECGVKANTQLMSLFLRRIGLTLKKRRWSPASRIGQT
jgi:transposase